MGCGNSKKNENQPIVAKSQAKAKAKTSTQLKPSASETLVQVKPDLKIDSSHFVIKNSGQLVQNYTQSVKIGQGPHSYVRVATHNASGLKRAIKSIDKSSFDNEDNKSNFLNEVRVLSIMDHPNIIKLYEFYEDETYFHLVTEYLGGGELFDYIIHSKILSEPVAAHFMSQLLSAIAYCHDNNIVHRDIKPENLLLDHNSPDAILKLIDFGSSAIMLSNKKLKQKCGDAFYIAPEILSKHGYDEKSDIWSSGVIMYILLSGRPPFYGKNEKDIIKKVLAGEFSVTGYEWDYISSDAIKLLQKMLEINPTKRISAKLALQDPWIVNNINKTQKSHDGENIVLKNLLAFRTEQKLQHAVLTFIAANTISKEQSKDLYKSFKKIDKDGDGKISTEELLQAYKGMMKNEEALEEVQKIMATVDLNGSGYIDYSEFVTASLKKEILVNNDTLNLAFKAFDIDGSGKISINELKEVLGLVQDSDENITNLLKKVDENGDGDIDIEEFKNMMFIYMSNSGNIEI
ncbi:hypothetical protein SteCoe_19518 [Stentor coeruleus]|uniref:non-specific serine/threonine protein kinase n=1 Tax=Stentor coeruleus TaxID=5963 RepID=A0A1R2BU21_9CILI|nr:hypothetical protein SteCoe_19518 [Stentor coeruleus]